MASCISLSNQFGNIRTMEIKERTKKIVSSENSFNLFVLVPADFPPKTGYQCLIHSTHTIQRCIFFSLFKGVTKRVHALVLLRLGSVGGKTAGVGAG